MSSGPPPLDPVKYRFFFPDQITNLAKYVSRLGMTEDVMVTRRTQVAADSPSHDYGDDEIEYVETADAVQHWVKGWIYSTPTTVQQVDTGAIITVNTYSFRCPLGTDILPGDEIVINGNDYIVSDTTAENTWATHIICSLRRRE